MSRYGEHVLLALVSTRCQCHC